MSAAVAGLFRMLPRLRMGPASRVSLGLCSLMIATLLAMDFIFGVLPDQDALVRDLRERISEQVAAQTAAAIGSGDPRTLHVTLHALVKDPQLISVAVRRRGQQKSSRRPAPTPRTG